VEAGAKVYRDWNLQMPVCLDFDQAPQWHLSVGYYTALFDRRSLVYGSHIDDIACKSKFPEMWIGFGRP
jgi:hypothetical protein